MIGVTEKVPPLHIIEVCAGMTGFGFTVTVIVNGVPEQVPESGVTI